MAKIDSLLQQRFRKKEKPKMEALAQKSNDGHLTVFSGLFKLGQLGEKEKHKLSEILQRYAPDDETDISDDLNSLISISSEVKAINNQAAILHGERIKIAQNILKKYRDGAFTAWLMTTYGNRQTPYNFLQYFEFHSLMPKTLHSQIEAMPRQAIYTLASRSGDLSKKEEIIRNYKGETKQQVITLIRSLFPLNETDRRRENIIETSSKTLQRLISLFERDEIEMTKAEKRSLFELIDLLKRAIERCG